MEKVYKNIKKLNRNLNFLKRRINIKEKEFIKKSNLNITHRELEYIVIIKDNEGKNISWILKELDVSKSTWSNQLKILLSKNLVYFINDEKDKRIKHFYLTDKGKKVYKIHKDVRKWLLRQYQEYLTSNELDLLDNIIEKLIKHVNKK